MVVVWEFPVSLVLIIVSLLILTIPKAGGDESLCAILFLDSFDYIGGLSFW